MTRDTPDGAAPNPHFESLASWEAAAERLGCAPRVPHETLGCALGSLALFVRDHRMREVSAAEQSLEAHYGEFVFTQSRPGAAGALRAVREVSYGSAPLEAEVSGCEARIYELGPVPPADDIDPRMPAVVVWADGEHFFLVASGSREVRVLLDVARSVR